MTKKSTRASWIGFATGAALTMIAGAAQAGPPFRTDDPEPVEYQHWEVYGFSQATHLKGDTSGTLPGVEVNYGIVPDVMVHVVAPIAFDHPAGIGTKFGYGDTEFGVKYRFIQEDEKGWRPMVGVFPLYEAPTGNAHRGLGTGHGHAFLPLWLQKSFGDWMTYGGGYWINPGAANRNYWFAGWVLQRQVTEQLAIGSELYHQTASASQSTTVGGKDTSGFNLGGVYDITENHHILFSAGRAFQNVSSTNELSYYAAYQLTF